MKTKDAYDYDNDSDPPLVVALQHRCSTGLGSRDPDRAAIVAAMTDQPARLRVWLPAARRRQTAIIALFSVTAILVHLVLRFAFHPDPTACLIPLWATLALGGVPLVYGLLRKLGRREFGSDLLAGISIVTSVLLEEYLAGSRKCSGRRPASFRTSQSRFRSLVQVENPSGMHLAEFSLIHFIFRCFDQSEYPIGGVASSLAIVLSRRSCPPRHATRPRVD